MDKNYLVYIIKNTLNDKVYIGQTTATLQERFHRHTVSQLDYPDHFHRALKKYGIENFYIELLDDSATNQDELDEKEIYYILQYDKKTLYNIRLTKGRCGGDTLTNHPDLDQIKEKISKNVSGSKNSQAVGVIAYNIVTKEEIIFGSMSECRDYFNMNNHQHISRRCLGKIKCPYKNEWQFKYLNK